MKEPFEIEWMGGAAERHFRRLRPDVAALPWGTIDGSRYPEALRDRARISWTRTAVSEYRAALAFGELLRTMLEAKVPLDLIGMAGDFIADEVSHVEIASRIAMELGGGAPVEIDTSAMLAPTTPDLSPLQRANEQVLRVSCIHERFSGAIVTATMRVVEQPLMRAAEELIARDEARHVRLGSLYFEWAAGILEDDERLRLAEVAMQTLERLAPLWRQAPVELGREGFALAHVRELGWLDRASFRARAIKAVREEIAEPLARVGIELPRERVDAILAE